MSKNYPLPPHPWSNVGERGLSACESLGYHPYPLPTALASVPYVNQYGVQSNECAYDGWCGEVCNYACETGAKANFAFRTVPAAIKTGNLTMALNSYVFRLDIDPSSGMATAARYYDPAGNVHVQPAKVFYNGLWGINVVRLFLLSGIGRPYNPTTVLGSMGRGLQYGEVPPGIASVTGTLNVGQNLYPSGNAFGGAVDILDFADDNFDHTGLNFVGGGRIILGTYPGGGPKTYYTDGIVGTMNSASQGSDFKAGLKDLYLPKTTVVRISMDGPELEDKRWYIDLDPHYTDMYGDPLGRYTQDLDANAIKCGRYLSGSTDSVAYGIMQKMGCADLKVDKGVAPGSINLSWFPIHIRGGCRIGRDPSTSALNRYGQAWDLPNVFAGGEITNTTGDNTTTGGTHPMGANLYVQAEGILRYLQSPGPLA